MQKDPVSEPEYTLQSIPPWARIPPWERPVNSPLICYARTEVEIAAPDPNRGLMRKAVDAVLDFLGYRRSGDKFRDRMLD